MWEINKLHRFHLSLYFMISLKKNKNNSNNNNNILFSYFFLILLLQNSGLLMQHKIKYIVNCTSNMSNFHEDNDHFTYLRFDVCHGLHSYALMRQGDYFLCSFLFLHLFIYFLFFPPISLILFTPLPLSPHPPLF